MHDQAIVRPKRVVSLIAILLAVATIVTLLSHSATRDLIESANDWAKDLMSAHPVGGAAVFLAFSALSAMLAFASSAVLVPSANLAWGKSVTFLLLWGGWIVGAVAAFGIGSLARPLLVKFGYSETLEKYRQLVSKRMKFWAVVLFCIAVPSEVPGYLFGGAHYSLLKFIAAIAIAESIYALGLVVAGESLLAAKPLPLVATITVLVLVGVAAGFLLRALKRRRARGIGRST